MGKSGVSLCVCVFVSLRVLVGGRFWWLLIAFLFDFIFVDLYSCLDLWSIYLCVDIVKSALVSDQTSSFRADVGEGTRERLY